MIKNPSPPTNFLHIISDSLDSGQRADIDRRVYVSMSTTSWKCLNDILERSRRYLRKIPTISWKYLYDIFPHPPFFSSCVPLLVVEKIGSETTVSQGGLLSCVSCVVMRCHAASCDVSPARADRTLGRAKREPDSVFTRTPGLKHIHAPKVTALRSTINTTSNITATRCHTR